MTATLTTPPSAQWLRVQSPALTRLVLLELLTQDTLPLSAEMRSVLERASKSAEIKDHPITKHMGLWVDMAPLSAYATLIDERTWTRAALIYFLRRQAHFPLLKRLFPDVSRQEIQQLRQEIDAPLVSVHRQHIADADSRSIWHAWQDIQTMPCSEIEQWIELAQRFPDYPLNSLYQFLVVASK